MLHQFALNILEKRKIIWWNQVSFQVGPVVSDSPIKRFEVAMSVNMKITVIWSLKPFNR
jgi:hypothetical protein